MKLGILVNSDNNLKPIIGITEVASSRDHLVTIFAMDDGTKLLTDKRFVSLATLSNVSMSFCEHSTQELFVDTSVLPAEVISGSQYHNAQMNNRSDKIIVL